jgi:hypothetical protein
MLRDPRVKSDRERENQLGREGMVWYGRGERGREGGGKDRKRKRRGYRLHGGRQKEREQSSVSEERK